MNLQDQLKNDLKIAIKQKDEITKSILRFVLGEFDRNTVTFSENLQENKAIAIIKTTLENSKTMGLLEEVKILEKYLPKTLSEEETEKLIRDIIISNDFDSIKSIGSIMRILKNNPNVELSIAQKIVKQILK